MHQVDISQSVIDRVIKHRGKEHCYADLDPAKTAFVVVDLQNAFMLPGVAHVLCAAAPSIVPNVNRIAQTVRATGGLVVWVRNTFNQDSLVTWSVFHEMTGPERTAVRLAAMGEGSQGHQLWSELQVQPQDLIIRKDRYSAFIQGSSNLAPLLRDRGIDTVIVGGTVTNVCCDSTARDAMMLNFKTIMVTDANAAHTDEEHNAALVAFYLGFGDIMPTEMLIACLQANAKSRTVSAISGVAAPSR